jgi:cytochrome c-type biogenesis protein CcmH
MRLRVLVLPLLALLLLGIAAPTAAQDGQPRPVTDDQVNAIARQLYCPVCENTPLDVCPTQACAQWRALIREKLGQDWSEAQIKQYFVDQYGDRVLATPPARGLNWLVYLLPPVLFLMGAGLLVLAFRSWRKPVPPPATAPTTAATAEEDDYLRRLEDELRAR